MARSAWPNLPKAEEKAMLDRELEDCREHPKAGASWDEVEARLGGPSHLR